MGICSSNQSRAAAVGVVLSDTAEGQFKLYVMNARGRGVLKDEESAVLWLKKSANQGFPEAQYHLALCYQSGIYRPEKPKKAISWIKKAARQEHPESLFHLGYCYYKGNMVEQKYWKAFRCFKRAIIQKENNLFLDHSFYYLGECFRLGRGVLKNIKKSTKMYEKAAMNGHVAAKERIIYLAEETKSKSKTKKRRNSRESFVKRLSLRRLSFSGRKLYTKTNK